MGQINHFAPLLGGAVRTRTLSDDAVVVSKGRRTEGVVPAL